MKSKIKKILLHILCCLGFLTLPIIFSPNNNWFADLIFNPFSQRDLFGYILLIVFFYFNFYFLIPKILLRKKHVLYGVIILAFLVIIIIIPMQIIQEKLLIKPPHDNIKHFGPPLHDFNSFIFQINEIIFLYAALISISIAVTIRNQWKLSEKEKIKAELSYLKAQINPHFLFNTLNSIYSLAIEKSDKTPDAIVKLSGMMRYVISENKNDFVSLEKELNYLSDYIELQKIRLENTVNIIFTTENNTHGKQIAPMLLIPFIENAFKYGVNPDADSFIAVDIEVNENELILFVQNKKVGLEKSKTESHLLGLENSRLRLNIIYPDKHELKIHENDSEFSVSLKISFI